MPSLGQTNVTAEFVADKLQEKRHEKVSLKDAKVKVIGEEGFMSNLFQVEFNWEKKTDLPLSVVIKIPSASKVSEATNQIAFEGKEAKCFDETIGFQLSTKNHQTEICAYNLLGQDPPVKVPKIYFARNADIEKEQDAILVMEDLTDNAMLANYDDGLTLDQVFAVADELALLHAFSLKLEKGWDKHLTALMQENMKFGLNFLEYMKNVALTLPKVQPDRFVKYESLLEYHFTGMQPYKAFMSHVWLGMPAVLVHGDMWIFNLLWAKDASGQASSELLSIIDFQNSHPGNVAEDLARLLATSVSSELRRNHLDTILRHYHTKLHDKLGYEPYTIEQVYRAYQSVQPNIALGVTFGCGLAAASSGEVEGLMKTMTTEKVFERTEHWLADFAQSQDMFSLSLGEKIKWYAIQAVFWLYLKFI